MSLSLSLSLQRRSQTAPVVGMSPLEAVGIQKAQSKSGRAQTVNSEHVPPEYRLIEKHNIVSVSGVCVCVCVCILLCIIRLVAGSWIVPITLLQSCSSIQCMYQYTVDREIFALNIFRVRIFSIKNFS